MAVLQQFKCPCCDGAIEFDSASQKLKCPYCDNIFELETLAAYNEGLEAPPDDMRWEEGEGTEWTEDESTGLRTYVCQSCAGEIVGDANLAATECPFCGNHVVMKGQLTGDLKPDLVLPFKLDKAAAKAALKKHYEGKVLLPKIFKDENHIDEVKGIYVPFWLCSAAAKADLRYRATRVRTWSDSRYIYTETQHYAIHRAGTLGFGNVPVDGSSKMDDAMMESIEPFDLSAAVDFQTAYLAGYLADKYDVTAKTCEERANQRIRQSTEDIFKDTVEGYTTVIPGAGSVSLENSRMKYALLPVWILNTTWKGQRYTFAMNGQTGKMAGDLPVDKGLLNKWFWGITAAAAAVSYAIGWLIWLL